MIPDAPFSNLMGSLFSALFGGLAAGFVYIMRLGSRVTTLEAKTEERHEANIEKLNRIEEAIVRVEDILIKGARR